MNSTNRGFNRLLILVVAVILIAAGAAAIALAALPVVARQWGTTAKSVMSSAPTWIADPAVGAASLLTIAVGVVAVILAILLTVFIARQGRGHTTRLVERHDGDTGSTLVDLGVPRTLLETELADRPEFVATRISAYLVRKTPALKVSVQCRRGVAPTDATAIVVRALEGLDDILGVRIPALVQVSGGFRSRVSSRARLD